jgi:hypothetical protein
MARLTRALVRLAPAAVGLFSTACPSPQKEPPPPAEADEIASAAPHALGALAAGTDAAPHALSTPGARPAPDEAAPEPDDDEEDGGAAPPPDAGAMGPEDVPL